MTINAAATVLLGMYLSIAVNRAHWDKVGGTIQKDVLKNHLPRQYIYPPSRRSLTVYIIGLQKQVPRWKPSHHGYISVNRDRRRPGKGFTLASHRLHQGVSSADGCRSYARV